MRKPILAILALILAVVACGQPPIVTPTPTVTITQTQPAAAMTLSATRTPALTPTPSMTPPAASGPRLWLATKQP